MTNDFKVLSWIAIVAAIVITTIVSFTAGYVLGYNKGSSEISCKTPEVKLYYARGY